MKRILLISFVVVLILYAIYYRAYIVYFFKLLKGEIRHNNKIKNLKNKNKKSRLLKSSEIKKYVECSIESLRKINHSFGIKYKLEPYLMQKLKYSRLDDKSVIELYESICKHMNINKSEIEFRIRRTSSRSKTPIAGSYGYIDHVISIEISTYTTIDRLVATIAHECTHHIFHSNNMEIKDIRKNEILTDTSAIILGFGEYFCKAYKDESRIIYEGEFLELIDREKLGYIGYKDVKSVMKYSKRIKNKKF
ncbi:MAG: hypothetical protein J6J36_03320 [Clostridia bacterium]|nr:hypothetical protein [Clostridia bacterium]